MKRLAMHRQLFSPQMKEITKMISKPVIYKIFENCFDSKFYNLITFSRVCPEWAKLVREMPIYEQRINFRGIFDLLRFWRIFQNVHSSYYFALRDAKGNRYYDLHVGAERQILCVYNWDGVSYIPILLSESQENAFEIEGDTIIFHDLQVLSMMPLRDLEKFSTICLQFLYFTQTGMVDRFRINLGPTLICKSVSPSKNKQYDLVNVDVTNEDVDDEDATNEDVTNEDVDDDDDDDDDNDDESED